MGRFGRWGWIPVIAALICCVIMALLESRRVADTVRDGAEAALDGAGLGDAVAFGGIDGFDGIGRDGLNVVLEGPAAAEEAAVDAVRSRSEVDEVVYRVTDDGSAATESEGASRSESDTDSDAEEAEDEAEPAPAAGLAAATISATATGDTINLTGVVPDEDTRSLLITAAVEEYGPANVIHDIDVDPESVTLAGATLELTGNAVSADEQAGWVDRVGPVAAAGGLEFVDQTVVKTIAQSLNELFELEPIEFDVNQATIRTRSEPTLAAAAELINANPEVGRLRVVGHTDSDGSAAANQQLSQARAQAVVDHLVANGGVEADRLEAEGRGESELLVDPDLTPEDKQRNRRIEWELLS